MHARYLRTFSSAMYASHTLYAPRAPARRTRRVTSTHMTRSHEQLNQQKMPN